MDLIWYKVVGYKMRADVRLLVACRWLLRLLTMGNVADGRDAHFLADRRITSAVQIIQGVYLVRCVSTLPTRLNIGLYCLNEKHADMFGTYNKQVEFSPSYCTIRCNII